MNRWRTLVTLAAGALLAIAALVAVDLSRATAGDDEEREEVRVFRNGEEVEVDVEVDGEEADTDRDREIKKKHKVVVVGPRAGKGAYLGVNISDGESGDRRGVRIDDVVEDSPADEAGLRDGDLIVEFEGEEVESTTDLTQRIHAARPGSTVDVTVLRDGRRRTIEVELGSRARGLVVPGREGEGMIEVPLPDTEALEEHMRSLEKHLGDEGRRGFRTWTLGARPRLGVQLVETTPELREHLGGDEGAGVLVGKVMSGMPAERAGIRVGDLIVSVDGHEVGSAGELVEALSDKEGETVSIDLIRDGRRREIDVEIPEADEDDFDGPKAGLRLDHERLVRAEQALAAAQERFRQRAEAMGRELEVRARAAADRAREAQRRIELRLRSRAGIV